MPENELTKVSDSVWAILAVMSQKFPDTPTPRAIKIAHQIQDWPDPIGTIRRAKFLDDLRSL